MGLLGTFKGIAGALPVVGGTISGALDGAESLAGIVASGQRSISSPCPGTPAGLAAEVAKRLNAIPGEADRLRTFLASNPPPDKDFQQLRAIWADNDNLATGAVWTAWGGGDCKVGTREAPLQAELQRLAALPLPSVSAGGGAGFLATSATSPGGGGLSLPVIGLIVGVAGLALALARRK